MESDNNQSMRIFRHIEERLRKQLEFIIEIDKIKSVFRKTLLFDSSRYENDAEHAWHLAVMAIVLAEYSDQTVDLNKVIKMVLIHDIVEIDAGDTIFYETSERKLKAKKEENAAQRIFGILDESQKQEFIELWHEFEDRQTVEAKFASALDRLEPIMQNVMTDGHAWKKHGISKEDVLMKNAPMIQSGSAALWSVVEKLISESFDKNS